MSDSDRVFRAQTATNAAATVTAAMVSAGVIGAGDSAVAEKFSAVRAEALEFLDNIAASSPAPAQQQQRGGGQRRQGGGQGSSITLEASLAMDLTGGKFKGKTLGELLKMSAQEAFDTYGYQDRDGNPRSGRDYVDYLASELNPNEFSRRRAIKVIEGVRSGEVQVSDGDEVSVGTGTSEEVGDAAHTTWGL
jgi:hypothetical protein